MPYVVVAPVTKLMLVPRPFCVFAWPVVKHLSFLRSQLRNRLGRLGLTLTYLIYRSLSVLRLKSLVSRAKTKFTRIIALRF